VPTATRGQAAEFLKMLEDNELDNLDRVFEYMDKYQKPVIMSNHITEAFRESRTFTKLKDNGVMMYPTPERAVRALAGLVQYSQYLKEA
jgi:acyl-CoA synthetase (NDP forming)